MGQRFPTPPHRSVARRGSYTVDPTAANLAAGGAEGGSRLSALRGRPLAATPWHQRQRASRRKTSPRSPFALTSPFSHRGAPGTWRGDDRPALTAAVHRGRGLGGAAPVSSAWRSRRAACGNRLGGVAGGSVVAGVGPLSPSTPSPFRMLRGHDEGDAAHIATLLPVTLARDRSSSVRSQMAVWLLKTTIRAASQTRSLPVSGLTGINHPVPGPWLIGAHETS